MADIFISYSQKDRVVAEELAAFLKESGYSVWWDYDLVGGTQFRQQIKTELATAKVAIVIWTPNSVESEWVVEEADQAKADKKLLPTRLPDLDYKSIPLGFRQIQTDPVTKPDLILRALDERKINPSSKPVDRKQTPVAIAGGIIDASSVAMSDEIAQWSYIKQSSSPHDFYGFLEKYPSSDFAELARTRINALEEKAWAGLAGSESAQAIAAFLQDYPAGRFGREAQRVLYNLEDAAWSKVDKNDPTALVAHKKQFPNSFSRAWIDTRLAELDKQKQEEVTWANLSSSPSKAGIEDYIRRFPLGAHVDAARSMLAPLDFTDRRAAKWSEIKERSFSEQLRAFIDEFKDGPEVREAQSILSERLQKKEEAAWEKARHTRHPAELLLFIRDFPNSELARQAVGALQALPHRIDDEAWSVIAGSDNILLYEGYLAAVPQGLRVKDARRKLGLEVAIGPPSLAEPAVEQKRESPRTANAEPVRQSKLATAARATFKLLMIAGFVGSLLLVGLAVDDIQRYGMIDAYLQRAVLGLLGVVLCSLLFFRVPLRRSHVRAPLPSHQTPPQPVNRAKRPWAR